MEYVKKKKKYYTTQDHEMYLVSTEAEYLRARIKFLYPTFSFISNPFILQMRMGESELDSGQKNIETTPRTNSLYI